MGEYEAGEAAMRSLAADFRDRFAAGNANEAETRFHLIDRLLKECLRWRDPQITVERHSEREYTDYELGDTSKVMVVEAKRVGVSFELPSGVAGPTVALEVLRQGSRDLEAAIDQALGYAQHRGIPIAVVSNGHQLAAFLGSRFDGVPPREGRALVFGSLSEMESRFRELWEALSPPGIGARRIYRTLAAPDTPLSPEKLSSRIPGYPGFKNRNPVAAELQILGGMFMEDLLRDPEVEPHFLEECYCTSGALSQYALVGREILSSRYSIYFEKQSEVAAVEISDRHGVTEELAQDIVAASLAKRPILLVGDVGVGKTMFVRHFIHIDAAEQLKNGLVLYVDFGRQPALATDLRGYVIREFRRQLHETHGIDISENGLVRSAYRPELQRFARGIYGSLKETDQPEYRRKELEHLEKLLENEETHLRRVLDHLLRAQGRQTVIFLDNIDQRSTEFQEEVFLIAESLAATWSATCFVSLRPETFHKSKAEGSIAGYQPRVFTVSPPRIDKAIARRLTFALDLLKKTGRLPSFPKNVTLGVARLEDYIRVLKDAFTDNSELVELVENLSGGNVRRSLDFLMRFVDSAHVNTDKIFRILGERGSYTLPPHEFLRALLYGDHEHYDPSDNPIGNVFDITSPDGREHFLLLMILGWTDRAGSRASTQGYLSSSEIFALAQNVGYQPHAIDFAFGRAIRLGLLEVHPRPEMEVTDADLAAEVRKVRITTVGAYTHRKLVRMFAYVDAMIVDTPIVDPSVRDRVRDVWPIADRVDRAELFVDYLDSQWSLLTMEDLPLDWTGVSAHLRGEFQRIRSRLSQTRLQL